MVAFSLLCDGLLRTRYTCCPVRARAAGKFRSERESWLWGKTGRSSPAQQRKNKKNTFFEKQSREVIEKNRSGLKNKPKQTQKQSREVIENTYLWKKRTQNEPKNGPGQVVENKASRKTNRRTLAEGFECKTSLLRANRPARKPSGCRLVRLNIFADRLMVDAPPGE